MHVFMRVCMCAYVYSYSHSHSFIFSNWLSLTDFLFLLTQQYHAIISRNLCIYVCTYLSTSVGWLITHPGLTHSLIHCHSCTHTYVHTHHATIISRNNNITQFMYVCMYVFIYVCSLILNGPESTFGYYNVTRIISRNNITQFMYVCMYVCVKVQVSIDS